MNEDKAESSKPFDPLEPFRGMRDAYLDAMAKAMVEAVNTEGYAEATGAMLDNSLTISAPFREAMEKSNKKAYGRGKLLHFYYSGPEAKKEGAKSVCN